ncbi:unnamed protein product [Pedinophyceae sp. YPF-701]|nr:unnamed protein product [Pedinophyceae sp. YPF-701]
MWKVGASLEPRKQALLKLPWMTEDRLQRVLRRDPFAIYRSPDTFDYSWRGLALVLPHGVNRSKLVDAFPELLSLGPEEVANRLVKIRALLGTPWDDAGDAELARAIRKSPDVLLAKQETVDAKARVLRRSMEQWGLQAEQSGDESDGDPTPLTPASAVVFGALRSVPWAVGRRRVRPEMRMLVEACDRSSRWLMWLRAERNGAQFRRMLNQPWRIAALSLVARRASDGSDPDLMFLLTDFDPDVVFWASFFAPQLVPRRHLFGPGGRLEEETGRDAAGFLRAVGREALALAAETWPEKDWPDPDAAEASVADRATRIRAGVFAMRRRRRIEGRTDTDGASGPRPMMGEGVPGVGPGMLRRRRAARQSRQGRSAQVQSEAAQAPVDAIGATAV